MRLEELTLATLVKGILPEAAVAVVTVQWHGSDARSGVSRTSA